MEAKLKQLNDIIREGAAELGLIFVDGPDVTPLPPERVGLGTLQINGLNYTNGQLRGDYHFAVAEK